MDNIGKIGGYGFGLNPGYQSRKEENKSAEKEEPKAPVQPEQKSAVSADEVMKFLEVNHVFVSPAKVDEVNPEPAVDAGLETRVEEAIEQYGIIYDTLEKEFGEKLTPQIFDLAMDKLLGIDGMKF